MTAQRTNPFGAHPAFTFSSDRTWLGHFELLVRSILVRPDQPAIIILGHFSPQVVETHGYYGPEVFHNVVAEFYDVPYISTKHALYPSWIARPDSTNAYYADPVLANALGHELLAEVLIHYIQSQVCDAWSAVLGLSFDVVSPNNGDLLNAEKQPTDARGLFGGMVGGIRKGSGGVVDSVHNAHLHVPLGRIDSKPTDYFRFEEVQPFCVSANDLINPLPPSLFTGSGWLAHHPPPGMSASAVYDSYWWSNAPTSRLRVPIQVGAGDVAIYYLREPRGDVEGTGSAVECWVDNNYGGARTLSNAADVGEITPT